LARLYTIIISKFLNTIMEEVILKVTVVLMFIFTALYIILKEH